MNQLTSVSGEIKATGNLLSEERLQLLRDEFRHRQAQIKPIAGAWFKKAPEKKGSSKKRFFEFDGLTINYWTKAQQACTHTASFSSSPPHLLPNPTPVEGATFTHSDTPIEITQRLVL